MAEETGKETMIVNTDNYKQWIAELKDRVRSAQIKAAVSVNSELINLYWSIGQDIVERKVEDALGGNFYKRISQDLQTEFPNVKGFSERNIYYMRAMYVLFSPMADKLPQVVAVDKVPQAVAPDIRKTVCRIPWGHIRYIIDKHVSPEESFFYVQKTVENGWSRSVLLNMMETRLYESQGKAVSNFASTLPKPDSDYVQEITKDPYNFDFLTLSEDYRERELQRALEENVSRLLLELGKGFAYVGRQVRLDVDGDEYFCDMLFYLIPSKRYVVVELKTVKFEPEFVSKVNFYCNAVNHLIKGDDDNETIGLLICKDKNDLVAKWTVENAPMPIAISKYVLDGLNVEKKSLNNDERNNKTNGAI